MSALRRRKRDERLRPTHPRRLSRFGAYEQWCSPDVEKAVRPTNDQPQKPQDISNAYPKIMDPSRIGVAVSYESQYDQAPISATSTTSTSKLLPSPVSQKAKLATVSTSTHRQSADHAPTYNQPSPAITLSPVSARTDRFRPISPPSDQPPNGSTKKFPPAPLDLKLPAKAVQLPRVNQINKGKPRESTQSVNTIINDEPMSPPAQAAFAPLSKFSTHLNSLQGLAPPTQLRENAESRDYIPSYYMQQLPTLSTISASPTEEPVPPLPFSQASATGLRASTSGATYVPAPGQENLSGPITGSASITTPVLEKDRGASKDHAQSPKHVVKKYPQTTPNTPKTPPSRNETPTKNLNRPNITSSEQTYGLPANPRTPPKCPSPPRTTSSPSRSGRSSPRPADLSPATLNQDRIRSPPASWKLQAEVNRANEPKPHLVSSSRHTVKASQKKPLAPARRRSAYKGARESIASETSFETSCDEQEITPPEDQFKTKKQLSPLPESKVDQSPIAELKYPRIPRPANQAVARSTGSPTRAGRAESQSAHLRKNSSSSSLLEKRKGSDAANDLQKGLWITGSNGRTGQVTGYRQKSHVGSDSSRTSPTSAGRSVDSHDVQIRSPLWEPKLTPKRTSDGGLVIEVT